MPAEADEVLPFTPADVATPFVFAPGQAAPSPFSGAFSPTQGGPPQLGSPGEFRGLYGGAGALQWRPEWSAYRASRPGNTHWGVDIHAPVGTEVIAVIDGELEYLNQSDGLGLYAALHFQVNGKTYTFHYGHLSSANGAARSVSQGETIGRTGCSGNAGINGICQTNPQGLTFSSSHLHFALLPPQSANAPKRSNPLTVLGWTLRSPTRPNGL